MPAAESRSKRATRHVSRGGRPPVWLAGAAMLLSLVSCYGTLLLAAALSLLGWSLPLHEGAWAAAVTAFVLLTAAAVALGYLQYRAAGPPALAAAGAAVIVWVMFVRYDLLAEVAGFAALATAVAWDWRLKRKLHHQEKPHARYKA